MAIVWPGSTPFEAVWILGAENTFFLCMKNSPALNNNIGRMGHLVADDIAVFMSIFLPALTRALSLFCVYVNEHLAAYT